MKFLVLLQRKSKPLKVKRDDDEEEERCKTSVLCDDEEDSNEEKKVNLKRELMEIIE
jgi:hypothetical protein